MASEKVVRAMELIGGLNAAELREVLQAMGDEWGVSVSIVPPPPSPLPLPPKPEFDEFQIVLKEFGAKKLDVIKAVREVLPALGLKEAKDLVEAAPSDVGTPVNQEEADKIKAKLEGAGALVEVKGV